MFWEQNPTLLLLIDLSDGWLAAKEVIVTSPSYLCK